MSELTNLDLSNYIPLDKIGEGAFGSVYKVQDKSTGAIYAAKIFNDQEPEAYLTREVNILAGISNPCVIKYIGYSPTDFDGNPNPVIILECMQNGSLEHIIDEERRATASKKWDWTKKLIMIYGIAYGMKYLHHYNIIHRDLKPGNILADDNLYPKITDFGLSKREHLDTSQTPHSAAGPKGTCRWMAPETNDISYVNYEKPVDVYSFAMIVYEIMTSHLPFHKMKTDYQVFDAVLNGQRPEFDVHICKAIRDLIERCWDQDPSKRPTFEQIVDELESNPDFITDEIEVDDFLDYQDYVKDENKSFRKILVRQPKTIQNDEKKQKVGSMTPAKKQELDNLNRQYGMRYIPVSFPLDLNVLQSSKPGESILIDSNKGAFYDSKRWENQNIRPAFFEYIEKYERILNS